MIKLSGRYLDSQNLDSQNRVVRVLLGLELELGLGLVMTFQFMTVQVLTVQI